MPSVPARYIRDAAVDWPGEFFAVAGLPLPFGSAEIASPSFAVWSMLELLDCDFVHPAKEPTTWGAVLAGFVASNPMRASLYLRAHLAAGYQKNRYESLTDLPMDDGLVAAAITFAAAAGATPDDYANLRQWLTLSFAGFNTIPSDGGSGGEFLFGVDQFASLVAAIGQEMQTSHYDLMWTTPLVIIGHVIAQKSKQGGAKGIARPKDKGHIKQMIAEATEREKAGLLHPWQEADPLHYGLLGHENADEAYRLAVLQHEKRFARV